MVELMEIVDSVEEPGYPSARSATQTPSVDIVLCYTIVDYSDYSRL